MTGGTLIVSRAVKIYPFIKNRFTDMGFDKITITGIEKDGLKMLIHDMKPRIVFMGCKFYQCSTPYMITDLHKDFPKLNIAAISVTDFPDDLAMYFIINGARSYINFWDGEEQFFNGMNDILEGREFVSTEVQKRIDLRSELPMPAETITDRQKEVLRLLCNGFKDIEIADTLHISRRTVDTHRRELFTSLNVRNSSELIRVALNLEIINQNEINFFSNSFTVNPKINKNYIKRRK